MILFAKVDVDVNKKKRFEKIYKQGMGEMEIWVDKETGVNYLYHQSGYAGGLTVLLDCEGKPVITAVDTSKE